MQRQPWGFVHAVAVTWALELVFWMVVLAGYVLLSRLHAEPYVWVLATAVFAVIAFGVEWGISTFRCARCDLVATRAELCGRHVERA
jgi:hypothetical protein